MNTNTNTSPLEDSIAHWERMAELGSASGERPIGKHCALCRVHAIPYQASATDAVCVGCPVYAKTGVKACERTPYIVADIACFEYGMDSPIFKAAAREEIEFLKSLRPPQS